MARVDREAVVLRTDVLVLVNCHAEAFVAADLVAVATALAKELEQRSLRSEVHMFSRGVDLGNALVHLADERLVTSLSLKTAIHCIPELSVGLTSHIVFTNGSNHFLSFAPLVAAHHQELVRSQGDRFPLGDFYFDPACAVVVGALAQEGHSA